MNKKYIKLIIVLLILSILFFVTIGIKLIKQDKKNNYIIIDDSFIMENHNNSWSIINKNIKKYNWKFYNIYVDHEYFGNHYLYFNNNTYIFDSNKRALNYTGELIAFNNKDYKDLNIDIKNSIDNTYLNKLLKKDKISSIDGLKYNYYIDVDIDSDNEFEKIYVVTNKFSEENKTNIDVSYVFFVDNNKIRILYKEIKKNDERLSGCIPYIRNIIYDGEKHYVLLECASYSIGVKNVTLYEYSNRSFNKKLSFNYL